MPGFDRVSRLFYAETVSPAELALSLDTFFGILETEDTEAVRLFRRWLNDYFRQMAHDLVGDDLPELQTGEDQTMLAENFRIWRDKVFEEGLKNGNRASTKKIALKLISQGMPLEAVATTTDLSIDQLRVLLAEK